MDKLADRLNNRIDVYGKIKFENEFHEEDYHFDKIKSVWSEIIPTGGSLTTGQGDTIYAKITHKITVRDKSIPNLSNDMYFMYKGLKYDINFFQPNYKYKDAIEIMCTLVIQSPKDLGVQEDG
ncbi:phage head completion protein [Candidatus Clostridium helianthi]|uniref:Head-tail adaptor protein n=1 Tax=Candidatus Clostridium helianthi TaxID=3381660 RepID=A0ABW8SBM8_9CLOT